MADMMQFDLVSPERSLASVQAKEVQIPGAEGDFTAMPDHAPVISTLRPGILSVVTADGSEDYVVTGGFAEVTAEGASVLAERAFPKADLTQDLLDELIASASEAQKASGADGVDVATKLLADLTALGSRMGLEAKPS